MGYIIIKTIHLFAVFIYGGFLITDNLFLSKMPRSLSPDEQTKAREAFMQYVRKVVPPSLMVAVVTGIYLITQIFGEIAPQGLSSFQIMLSLKAFLGLWLGLRGFSQVYLGIQPLVFKSHLLPFVFVIAIILLSQLMVL